MKPVILIIIDALTSRVVIPALRRGELPHMAALAAAGVLRDDCISMFPSITPAATATLLTGCYPDGHGIAGAAWYDAERERVIYYSDDIWTILREGSEHFFEDFLVQMNLERLQTDTIFERVEQAGMRSASLNNLLYRGPITHELKVPLLLRLLPGAPAAKTVAGPQQILLGDFAAHGLDVAGPPPNAAGGVLHRFGFDDDHTAEVLLHLANTDSLPALTVAYFPNNDFHSHNVGPEEALESVRGVDSCLGKLIKAFGGVENLLDRYCLLLTGDHSHCDIIDNEQAGITLNDLLPEHTIADSGASWGDDDDLMVCLNLRAAQIYLRRADRAEAEGVAAALLADERIDQVLWRPRDVGDSDDGYLVLTQDRGRVHFWRGDAGPHSAQDRYGNTWSWQGDLMAVDGQFDQEGRLCFPAYPNAFERIAGGLDHEGAGPLWVTARPGYSLHLSSTSGIEIHAGGGSHGALHACDSVVPLLIAGAPEGVVMPDFPRTVDVTPLCLRVLGII